MNVASKELCAELKKLSGWKDTDYWHYKPRHTKRGEYWVAHISGTTPENRRLPAYDLGYLLRKLPNFVVIAKQRPSLTWAAYIDGSPTIKRPHDGDSYEDTPEDATAKLAITLFKANILVKGESK